MRMRHTRGARSQQRGAESELMRDGLQHSSEDVGVRCVMSGRGELDSASCDVSCRRLVWMSCWAVQCCVSVSVSLQSVVYSVCLPFCAGRFECWSVLGQRWCVLVALWSQCVQSWVTRRQSVR